jgi:hypothetical protein
MGPQYLHPITLLHTRIHDSFREYYCHLANPDPSQFNDIVDLQKYTQFEKRDFSLSMDLIGSM